MKKFMFVFAMVGIFISKSVMATYLYSFQGAPTSIWEATWSWEYSSASIFSTSTDIAGDLLTNKTTPSGWEILGVNINPSSTSFSSVKTVFDTDGDGLWNIFYSVGFADDIAQVGFFTRTDDLNTLTIAESVVPEPTTLALLGIALAGLGATRRRKHS